MTRDKYSQWEDIVIYQDKEVRLLQDCLGNTYYEAKCSCCGNWGVVDFRDTIKSIKGLVVGNPKNPITVTYPYRVKAVVSKCEECDYVHIFDAHEYSEITKFTAEEAEETCHYVSDFTKSTGRLKYKIRDAEKIAKYILAVISQSIFVCGSEDEYFEEVKKRITSDEIVDICLVTVILFDLIENKRYMDKEIDDWCDDGDTFLTKDEISFWELIAYLLL